MFGRQRIKELNRNLVEEIENDLISTFIRKGINVNKINFDLESGTLNMELGFRDKSSEGACINKSKKHSTFL